jgi:hypothetical protein
MSKSGYNAAIEKDMKNQPRQNARDEAIKEAVEEEEPGWFPYPGHYEKVFYDIRLKDGRVMCNCWPNAGQFHSVSGDGAYVDEKYVTHYRFHEDEKET